MRHKRADFPGHRRPRRKMRRPTPGQRSLAVSHILRHPMGSLPHAPACPFADTIDVARRDCKGPKNDGVKKNAGKRPGFSVTVRGCASGGPHTQAAAVTRSRNENHDAVSGCSRPRPPGIVNLAGAAGLETNRCPRASPVPKRTRQEKNRNFPFNGQCWSRRTRPAVRQHRLDLFPLRRRACCCSWSPAGCRRAWRRTCP